MLRLFIVLVLSLATVHSSPSSSPSMKDAEVDSLLDAIQTSYGPIPNLSEGVALLSDLPDGALRTRVTCVLIALTDAQRYRLLDQLTNPIVIRSSSLNAFLDSYPSLRQPAEALQRCCQQRQPWTGAGYPQPLLQLLRDVGVVDDHVLKAGLFRYWSDLDFVRRFVTVRLQHLLTDPVFLKRMMDVGARLDLIPILQHVRVPVAVLDRVVALYRGPWPTWAGDFNWAFLDEVWFLTWADSATSLAEFWTVPSIRAFYASVVGDRDGAFWRTLTPERVEILARVQFPFLDEMFAVDGVRRLLRAAVLGDDLPMIAFVLFECVRGLQHWEPIAEPPPASHADAEIETLLDALQTAYGPMRKLRQGVALLERNPARAASVLRHLRDASRYRLLNQLTNPMAFDGTELDRFLKRFEWLRQEAASLCRCHYGRRTATAFGGRIGDRLLALLGEIGVVHDDDGETFRHWSDDDVVRRFVAVRLQHLLTDPDFLKRMINADARFDLITILVHVEVRGDVLDPVLPLYHGPWPSRGLRGDNGLFNWAFVDDVRRLSAADSVTSLDQFWSVSSIRAFYQSEVEDDESAFWRTLTPSRLDLLRQVQFPFLDAILDDDDGVRHMFRAAVRHMNLPMVEFLLMPGSYGAAPGGRAPSRVHLDLNEAVDGRTLAQRLDWSALGQYGAGRRAPPLFQVVLAQAPESTWQRVCATLVDGVGLRGDETPLMEMVRGAVRHLNQGHAVPGHYRRSLARFETILEAMTQPVQGGVVDVRKSGLSEEAAPAPAASLLEFVLRTASESLRDQLKESAANVGRRTAPALEAVLRFKDWGWVLGSDSIALLEAIVRHLERIRGVVLSSDDDQHHGPWSSGDDPCLPTLAHTLVRCHRA